MRMMMMMIVMMMMVMVMMMRPPDGTNRLCSRALKQWLVCCNIEWRSALVPELAAFICTIVGSEIAVRVQSSFFGPIRAL